jgi:hypothetical protein
MSRAPVQPRIARLKRTNASENESRGSISPRRRHRRREHLLRDEVLNWSASMLMLTRQQIVVGAHTGLPDPRSRSRCQRPHRHAQASYWPQCLRHTKWQSCWIHQVATALRSADPSSLSATARSTTRLVPTPTALAAIRGLLAIASLPPPSFAQACPTADDTSPIIARAWPSNQPATVPGSEGALPFAVERLVVMRGSAEDDADEILLTGSWYQQVDVPGACSGL